MDRMAATRTKTVPEVGIAGDRRSDRRYPLELELRYKLLRRRRVLETGSGRTLDISSGGIRFEADRPLPAGLSVELSVTWPVLLRNVAPLQLVVSGRIVRSESNQVSIRMVQHEFRTQGASTRVCAFPVQPAIFASVPTVSVSRKIQ
jgi:hypothetical protein